MIFGAKGANKSFDKALPKKGFSGFHVIKKNLMRLLF